MIMMTYAETLDFLQNFAGSGIKPGLQRIRTLLDAAGNLLGEINIAKIRHIVFRTELYYHFKVRQLMLQPPAVLNVNDPMETVMHKFDETDAVMLPVVDLENHLQGYISRTHLYSAYRQMVADFSAD